MNTDPELPNFQDLQTRLALQTNSGRAVLVRRVSPADGPRLLELYLRLSPQSVALRFFGAAPLAPQDAAPQAERMAGLDPARHLALAASITEGDQERFVGVARYGLEEGEPLTAEFAVVIRDDYQKDGLGSKLLNLLARTAQASGVRRMRITWRSQNQAIQRLILRAGLPFTSETHLGETTTLMEIPA